MSDKLCQWGLVIFFVKNSSFSAIFLGAFTEKSVPYAQKEDAKEPSLRNILYEKDFLTQFVVFSICFCRCDQKFLPQENSGKEVMQALTFWASFHNRGKSRLLPYAAILPA